MHRILLSIAVATSLVGQQPLQGRILLATVTVTGNRQLYDLDADDFVVDEGGATREVLSVHLADYPIGLLIDSSGDAAQLEAIRTATARFISRSGERPVAVADLANPGTLASSFAAGRQGALDAVARLKQTLAEPMPLEAAATMAEAIRDVGAPFSAIVVMSTKPTDAARITGGDLLSRVLESGVAIHVVGLRASNISVSPQSDVLRALADQTHGQFTTIYSPVSVGIALDRLADRLATEMMIEYVLPPGTTPGGDVHVGVKIPGASVRGLGVK